MTDADIHELARQAIAALELDIAAYTAQDNGDGSITIHIYGGGVVVWPPPVPQPETTLPVSPRPHRRKT